VLRGDDPVITLGTQLLGLLNDKEGVAAGMLTDFGINIEALRAEVEKNLESQDAGGKQRAQRF
jgi:hypothetical protein